jgi:hypothetical protein
MHKESLFLMLLILPLKWRFYYESKRKYTTYIIPPQYYPKTELVKEGTATTDIQQLIDNSGLNTP